VINRREPLPAGYTAEQHAEDYIQAIEDLRWGAGSPRMQGTQGETPNPNLAPGARLFGIARY
jgi:hypothetical protein